MSTPLHFDPTRGCGSKNREANRYTRGELEKIAHSYDIQTKNRNMDKICRDLKKIVKNKPKRHIDRCNEKIDAITNDVYDDDSDVVYIIMINDRNNAIKNAQCILRDNLIRSFTLSNEVYQWTVNRNSVCCENKDYRVYKDPMKGIWYLKSALESIQDTNHKVYVATPIAKHTIGSTFSASSLHGASEMLHYLWKLPLDLMDKWWSGDLTATEIQRSIDSDNLPDRLKDEFLPYDASPPPSRHRARPAARRGGRTNTIGRGVNLPRFSIPITPAVVSGNNPRLVRSNAIPLNRNLFADMMMPDVYIPPPNIEDDDDDFTDDNDEDDELIDEIYDELNDSESPVY